MINIRGSKNHVLRRGETFEFAFKINLSNLLKAVYFDCPKLGIHSKKCSFYEGCFYVRLEANETLDIDPELTAVSYAIVVHTTSGTVTSLFIDGIIEITEGANSDTSSVIDEYEDSLSAVTEFSVNPSFEVDIYDWLRIQLPAMKHGDGLPEPSRDTMYQFFYNDTDNKLYLTVIENEQFVWKEVSLI